MSETRQSFENHAKMVPGYHYVLSTIILALLVYAVYRVATDFSLDNLFLLVVTVAIMLVGFYGRAFALAVQDRVIRLEERLRLERLLPAELRARVPELTTEQLIAIRFASDGEVAELVGRVLSERMTDRKAIKALVRDWRPDNQRA